MKEVTATELQKLLKEPSKVEVIDVRETMEVQMGMIPNAIHIPLGEIQSRMSELEKKKEYVIVCRSGNRRDRKSTRLNSSHVAISYAVFCLKKKKNILKRSIYTRQQN